MPLGRVNFASARPGVIRQSRRGPDAVGHGADAALVQPQAVQHHGGDVPLGVGHVLRVGGEDGGACGPPAHRPWPAGARFFSSRRQRRSARATRLWFSAEARWWSFHGPPCEKSGAGGLSLGDVVEHLRRGAVGDDHFAAGGGGDLAAARSFVTMPPVPRPVPLSSARVKRSSSTRSTVGIRRASGWWRGSSSYRPVDVRQQHQQHPRRWRRPRWPTGCRSRRWCSPRRSRRWPRCRSR